MTEYDDLERRALDTLDTIKRTFNEHSRIIIGTAAIAFLAAMFGIIDPSIPAWWPLIPWMLLAGMVAAFVAAIWIYALIPEREGILLVSLRADEDGGQVWELYEDTWEEMSVDGQLYEWAESPRRVYEVRDYLPEENHAIANWREAKPASAILAERTPEDAIEAVAELRQIYEPEAARARRMQRRIRGIVRRLDQERTRARAEQLDQATGLESIDSPSITEILEQELPEDLHPESGRTELTNGDGGFEWVGDRENGDRVDVEPEEFEPIVPDPDINNGEPEVPRGL